MVVTSLTNVMAPAIGSVINSSKSEKREFDLMMGSVSIAVTSTLLILASDFNSTAGQDWINKNEEIITALADPMRFGKTKARLFYATHGGNGDIFDYKSKAAGGVYSGSQISPGIYASARDVGNYFAGSVARITGQSKLDFLTTAGAFNLHGNDKLDLVLNLTTYKAEATKIPITYGENERSNYYQRLGYEGTKTLKSFNTNYIKMWKDE